MDSQTQDTNKGSDLLLYWLLTIRSTIFPMISKFSQEVPKLFGSDVEKLSQEVITMPVVISKRILTKDDEDNNVSDE